MSDVARIWSIITFHLSKLWKSSSPYCVMSYFLWGCRGILTLITLRSERVKDGQPNLSVFYWEIYRIRNEFMHCTISGTRVAYSPYPHLWGYRWRHSPLLHGFKVYMKRKLHGGLKIRISFSRDEKHILLAALVRKILFSPLENKIYIFAPPYPICVEAGLHVRRKHKHKPCVNRDDARTNTSAHSFFLRLCRPGSHVAYVCACVVRVNQSLLSMMFMGNMCALLELRLLFCSLYSLLIALFFVVWCRRLFLQSRRGSPEQQQPGAPDARTHRDRRHPHVCHGGLLVVSAGTTTTTTTTTTTATKTTTTTTKATTKTTTKTTAATPYENGLRAVSLFSPLLSRLLLSPLLSSPLLSSPLLSSPQLFSSFFSFLLFSSLHFSSVLFSSLLFPCLVSSFPPFSSLQFLCSPVFSSIGFPFWV